MLASLELRSSTRNNLWYKTNDAIGIPKVGVGKTLHKSALPRPHHHLSSPKIDRSTEGSKPLMVSNNMHTVKMTQLNSILLAVTRPQLTVFCKYARAEEEDTEYVDVCVRIRCESSPTSTVCACLANDNAVVLPALPSGPKGSKPTFFYTTNLSLLLLLMRPSSIMIDEEKSPAKMVGSKGWQSN